MNMMRKSIERNKRLRRLLYWRDSDCNGGVQTVEGNKPGQMFSQVDERDSSKKRTIGLLPGSGAWQGHKTKTLS